MEYRGTLETHWTVPEGAPGLDAVASALGLTVLRIELAAGLVASQPMLTRRRRGSLSSELAASDEVTHALARHGVAVRRVKIEAHPDNEDVPQRAPDDGRYFEHHVKLLLTEGDPRVAAIAERHDAHLSRNALRLSSGGLQERFLTQRCRGLGRLDARDRLDALVAELREAGLVVLDAEQEYVVYDSNEGLDLGWMEGG